MTVIANHAGEAAVSIIVRVADNPTIRPLVSLNTKALFGSNGGFFRYEEGVFGCRRGRYARVRPLSE